VSRRSVQLTYWEVPGSQPDPEVAPAEAQPGNPLHGWSFTDIHGLSRLAASTAWATASSDFRDKYDAAWHGICEYLLTASEPPSRRDLVRAGQDAVNGLVVSERHHHGYAEHTQTSSHGPGTMPAFARYWQCQGAIPSPSPEASVVERLAVAQIAARLSPSEMGAVSALAAAGTPDRAAEALGVSLKAFHSSLARARRRFLALWHEGEEPSRLWRPTVPGWKPGDPRRRPLAPCGTPAAYARHVKRGEVADDDCKAASRDAARDLRAGRRAMAGEAA
jgi:hypothetical protein